MIVKLQKKTQHMVVIYYMYGSFEHLQYLGYTVRTNCEIPTIQVTHDSVKRLKKDITSVLTWSHIHTSSSHGKDSWSVCLQVLYKLEPWQGFLVSVSPGIVQTRALAKILDQCFARYCTSSSHGKDSWSVCLQVLYKLEPWQKQNCQCVSRYCTSLNHGKDSWSVCVQILYKLEPW